MWPGESHAPTGFFGSFCNTISSCLGLLCCCWIFRDCLGRQRGPSSPLMAPPVDDRLEHLIGPHSPFGGSKPPGPACPMHDRPGHLGGPHRPFGLSHPSGPPGPMDDRLGDLGGPHSPFGVSNPPGHSPFGGPHSPFGLSDATDPPGHHRLPTQHSSSVHPGPPHPHGPSGLPEPPRVPGVQPGLL
ncbi:hypothetical protein L1987_17265 [Smallanthus sonchifolius]|uniref:Uncharacterized protein n=1 Tax=Smallanthus sonchifolius TaxID=185202 RepID=A0ACB9IXA5_9ASTR|nr:hypothetical protein L1987_17265 [Smallanthus sonchifolius]